MVKEPIAPHVSSDDGEADTGVTIAGLQFACAG
jgi:hypothetical protein